MGLAAAVAQAHAVTDGTIAVVVRVAVASRQRQGKGSEQRHAQCETDHCVLHRNSPRFGLLTLFGLFSSGGAFSGEVC